MNVSRKHLYACINVSYNVHVLQLARVVKVLVDLCLTAVVVGQGRSNFVLVNLLTISAIFYLLCTTIGAIYRALPTCTQIRMCVQLDAASIGFLVSVKTSFKKKPPQSTSLK